MAPVTSQKAQNSVILIFWHIQCYSHVNTTLVPEKRTTNCFLRIHWRLSTILETSNKSAWSNVSWYVKVCIFWNCIQYIIHWDKTQILKKFPSEKINVTKNALFFLSRAPTHHIFNFNLRFLYELKHKVRLSKKVCGIFHFQFRSVFNKVYFIVQQNAWTLSL